MIEIYGGHSFRPLRLLLIASPLITNWDSHLPWRRGWSEWPQAELLPLAEREVIHLHPEVSHSELKLRRGADGASAATQRLNWVTFDLQVLATLQILFKVVVSISLGGHAAITQPLISGRVLGRDPSAFWDSDLKRVSLIDYHTSSMFKVRIILWLIYWVPSQLEWALLKSLST